MHPLRTLLLPPLLLLQACALPRTVQVYDQECEILARQMVLEVHDMQVLNNCSVGRHCMEQLAVGLAVLATSTVISGSIVIAGNVVYWMERQKNCRLKDRVTIPLPVPVPAPAPAPAPAPVPPPAAS